MTEHPDETTGLDGKGSRRTFLKRAGLGVALIGVGVVADETVRAVSTPTVPPRTVVTAADALRIDGVAVVDPTDGSTLREHSIVIRDGRIDTVLPTSAAPTETSMRVIDGAGRFAVPGYNDMHSHVLQSSSPELGFALMLAQGITGFRQMEGSAELLRDRAENRLGLNETAPRLLELPGALVLPFNAHTVQGVRDEIARQWDQGADFVKMVLTEREVFFAAITAAHSRGLRIAGHMPPPVRIDEAAASGFDCIEHLGTGLSVFLTLSSDAEALWERQPEGLPFPSWLVRLPFAGDFFDTFMKEGFLGPATDTTDADQLAFLRSTFATYSEDRAAELGRTFLANQTWNCPTLVGVRSKYRLDDPDYRGDPWLQKISSAEREKELGYIDSFSSTPAEDLEVFHEYYDRVLQTVGIWATQGAPIMTGTDNSGRGVGNTLALEFRELGRAGLTPLEVLQATTTGPATYLGRTDTMGRIAAGMNADLVLLDDDPLASVDNLGSISLVVRDGHDYSSADLDARVDELLAVQT